LEILPVFASKQGSLGIDSAVSMAVGRKDTQLVLHVNMQNSVINLQKSVAFVYTNNELSEKNSGNNPIYDHTKRNKIPGNKLNQEGGRPIF